MLEQSDITLFRDTVRKFLETEVAPHYDRWEREHLLPRELWNMLGAQGLLCVDMPEAYGGAGADFRLSAVVVEEVARMGFGGLASALSVHSDIVAPYILHLGSEEQKRRWLPRMVTGEAVGAIGMTEPGAGSDLQAMKTRATRDGDEFVINGQKTFITNGYHCDVLILAAKTDPAAGSKGVTLFTVDTSLPGFECGRRLEKIGQHASDTAELFFQDLRVGAEQILGGEGRGFINLMNELPRERLILGIGGIAAAEGTLARTVAYVQERKAFGQALAQFQNVRFKLAELKAQIEIHKAFVQQCVSRYVAGELTTTDASIAKLGATDLQSRVADECLQLFGGYGYMREYPVSRDFVDARVQRIYGGANEIMKELIARSLLGR